MTTIAIERQLDQVPNLEIITEDFSQSIQEQVTELTRAFIKLCQSLYALKLVGDRKEKRECRESLEWTSTTANPYAKVGEWIQNIDPYNLELLDIDTIKSLCCEKYKPILEGLEGERMTVAEVRSMQKEINEATKTPKEPKPMLEWKQSKEGKRSLTINDIDAETGIELEAKFKLSGIEVVSFFLRQLIRQHQKPVSTHLVELQQSEEIEEDFIVWPSDRYKSGWQVGQMVVPNTVGYKGSKVFVKNFNNQPAKIIEVSGGTGLVQYIKLESSTNKIFTGYSNWVEAVEQTEIA